MGAYIRIEPLKFKKALLLIFPTLQSINLLFIKDEFTRRFLSDLFQAAAAVTAAIIIGKTYKILAAQNEESKKSWLLIYISYLFYAMAMIVFMVVEVILIKPPYPGLADIFFVIFYPLLISGILLLPIDKVSRRRKLIITLDLLSFAFVGYLVIWNFNLRLLVASISLGPNPGAWMSLGYTFLDTILLMVLFYRLTLNLGKEKDFIPVFYLVLGGFFLISADLMQGYISTLGIFSSGSPVDIGWVMFSSFCGFAGLKAISESEAKYDPSSQYKRTLLHSIWPISITYMWIVLVFIVLIWSIFNGDKINLPSVILGGLGAILLAVSRQIITLRDNTKLVEELIVQREELSAANAELDSFSYVVSHDLRAPLRTLNGYSQILLDDYSNVLPDEAKGFISKIQSASNRMSNLINDLLRFSQVSRRKNIFDMIETEILVKEIRDELENDWKDKEVVFTLGHLPNCCGDTTLVRQVFHNLLSNAIKYSQNREKILIEIGTVPGHALTNNHHIFFIKDNGAGFDMKFYDKLFGVFQRLHTNEEFEGTGVGLALSKRIIERHGGKIWAESEVEKGATFYFSLRKN